MADEGQDHEELRKVNGSALAFGGRLDRVAVEGAGGAALVEGVEGGLRFLGGEEDGGVEGKVV